MRKKLMVLAGIITVLSLSAAGGCKKKDAAVHGQKPPVHEQIPIAKFSPSPQAILPNIQATPGGIGKVEWINDVMITDKAKVNKKEKLSLIGWVANDLDGTSPPTVVIQLNSPSGTGTFYASAARTKQKRPDVAKAFNNPSFENSSFQLDADISAVPQGKYIISFLLSNGKYIVGFDSDKFLEIK